VFIFLAALFDDKIELGVLKDHPEISEISVH